MSNKLYQPAPNNVPMLEQDTGLPVLPWILFFQGIYDGDTGSTWVPAPVNLTTVGTPTYAARYFKSGQFIDFEIRITPGTSTTAVGGSTYFPLPFVVKQDGPCFAVSGLTGGSNIGMVEAVSNRAYVPPWTAVTVPLTVTGRVRGG